MPNGALFSDGVCARIKEELLTNFNLHTIVRLPEGVFAPYTDIPANILFFDRSGPTKKIWYYQLPQPDGRKKYTKTKPMQFDEFSSCKKWWSRRKANSHAWKVKASKIIKRDTDGKLVSVNLDLKNPHSLEALEHLPPSELLESIIQKESEVIEVLNELKALISEVA